MDPNRFTQEIKDTLAKRASYLCSNPYCKMPTTGPHTEDGKSVNAGVAAHIRGANPGSCRYDSEMNPKERRAITNGIWLCQVCAKLIDSDIRRFTISVLYKWKMEHEQEILERIGFEIAERERRDRIHDLFKDESAAAKQIALDCPEYWEFLLVVELLRSKLARIKEKHNELRRGLIYRPSRQIVSLEEFRLWLSNKLADQVKIMQLIAIAIKEELNASVGELGEAGDAEAILRFANYIEHGCESWLEWDQDVVFTKWPEGLEDCHSQFIGWTDSFIEDIETLPNEIAKVLAQDEPKGNYKVIVPLNIPPGAVELFKSIFQKIVELKKRTNQ